MDQLSLPAPIEPSVLESKEDKPYANAIKKDIAACTEDLASISRMSMEIKAQGSFESWWNSGPNMRRLAENVAQAASVQQKTINMVVLLMAAAGRMKHDYNTIMESIEQLSQSHSGSVEVLEYLVKVKQTVESMKRRDDLLESLITYTNDLRQCLSELDDHARKQFEGSEREVSVLKDDQKKLGEAILGLQEKHDLNARATSESINGLVQMMTQQQEQLRKDLLKALDLESQSRREVEADLLVQIAGRSQWLKVALWFLVILGLGMSTAALIISMR